MSKIFLFPTFFIFMLVVFSSNEFTIENSSPHTESYHHQNLNLQANYSINMTFEEIRTFVVAVLVGENSISPINSPNTLPKV